MDQPESTVGQSVQVVNSRADRLVQGSPAVGCGGCLVTLIYVVAVAGVSTIGAAALVSSLSPATLSAYQLTHPNASLVDLFDLSQVWPGGLATSYAVALACVVVGGLLIWWWRSHFQRSRPEWGSAATAWDRSRLAARAPGYRAARWFGLAGLVCTMLPLLIAPFGGLIGSRLNGDTEQGLASVDLALIVFLSGYLLIGLGLFLGLIALVLVLVASLRRGKAPAKLTLVGSEVVGLLGSGVSYEPTGQLRHSPVGLGLVPATAQLTQHDWIGGVWRGQTFEQVDLVARITRSVWDDQRQHRTTESVEVFRGRWFVLQTRRPIQGRVLVRSVTPGEPVGSVESGWQAVELEDGVFNQGFDVVAESPHDAFYVLTPPIIERLKRLAGVQTRGEQPEVRLLVGFGADQVHLGFDHLVGAFDTGLDQAVSEAEARAFIRADLQVSLDVLSGWSEPTGKSQATAD